MNSKQNYLNEKYQEMKTLLDETPFNQMNIDDMFQNGKINSTEAKRLKDDISSRFISLNLEIKTFEN